MATQALPPVSIRHPASHRDRARLAGLLFGLSAAPVAWSMQLLFSVTLSGRVCYPHEKLLAAPLWSGSWPILLGFSVVGIIAAIAGGVVAWRSWRLTFQESPGSGHHLIDRGEGRTRFMAMSGMLTSAVFLIALAFGTIALFLVPLCGQ